MIYVKKHVVGIIMLHIKQDNGYNTTTSNEIWFSSIFLSGQETNQG
jgi:hypothetical protein